MPSEPLAYFLTFRTYGTWLPGDTRGSIDHKRASFGEPIDAANPWREQLASERMVHSPMSFYDRHRFVVADSIREVCAHRSWQLIALNVRTNHVHLVVYAPIPPETVVQVLKSWATRRLREARLVADDRRIWSRGSSTEYLWTEDDVLVTSDYTLNQQ